MNEEPLPPTSPKFARQNAPPPPPPLLVTQDELDSLSDEETQHEELLDEDDRMELQEYVDRGVVR
jgi:hypothetical protein